MAMSNVIQSPLPACTGRAAGNNWGLQVQHTLMPALDCWYPPAVEKEDVLRVDFSRKSIGPNGHYLIQIDDDAGGWRGCRKFRKHELNKTTEMDVSGAEEWREVKSLAAMNIEVVGYVEQIYKPMTGGAQGAHHV